MLPDKIIFRMFEGCSSFSKRHIFANTRHFRQQFNVFEIKHDVNNPKYVILSQVFYLQSTPRWEIRPSTVAITAAIFGLFCGYRLICLMNMFILTLLWHCITTEQNENAKCIKFKIYFFVHMHLISVKMGVVVFNR